MDDQHQPAYDTHENAVLYALNVLDEKSRAVFEEHLRSGCAACEEEVRSHQDTAGQLGFAAQPGNPTPLLRARLLEQTKKMSADSKLSAANAEVLFEAKGLLISRPTNKAWAPTPLAGIWNKTLFVQPGRQYATSLVRMEPGAVYPTHRHNDVEEVYLLEGDLLVQGCRMRPGDYCRSEPGSIHDPASTESGVLLLVLSSQRDELLL